MNEFIKLRESVSTYEGKYDFSKVYLERIMKSKNILNQEEKFYLETLKDLSLVSDKKELDSDKFDNLIAFIGSNPYIDRYIINILLSFYNEKLKERVVKKLKVEIAQSSNDKLYHLIDLVLEVDLDILLRADIEALIQDNFEDFDLLSLLFESLDQFNLHPSKEFLHQELEKEYPNTLKTQIIALLFNLYSLKASDIASINSSFKNENELKFIKDYIKFLKGDFEIYKKDTVILQSMFYGDFEDSGKGNNGGLAILLKGLGNEVSSDKRVDLVLTITLSDQMKKPFMVYYHDQHLFVRLPAYLNRSVVDPFLKRELYIKRYIRKYLEKLKVDPFIYHIRYLDNASNAVAKLSKELNKKLVLTLAPDPHRNMVDEEGKLKEFGFEELQILLNKITIGDKLIFKSDKILGIGGQKVNKELSMYFPQFKLPKIEDKIKMISEGIKTDSDMFKEAEDLEVCQLSDLIGIDPSFSDKPIILNVGRLATLKGQVELFKAWSKSNLHKTHNLLIIGGDLESPNSEEKEVIDFFEKELEKNSSLKTKFYHLGALANEKIKLVEKSIMKKSFNYPHIYLASSLKEEFGLAILEGMSRGFLIMAPIKGGVKSYINNGENGFLIDTSSYSTMAKEAENILYKSSLSMEEFKAIQNKGIKTVQDNFSIDKIAATFADTYMSLIGDDKNEI